MTLSMRIAPMLPMLRRYAAPSPARRHPGMRMSQRRSKLLLRTSVLSQIFQMIVYRFTAFSPISLKPLSSRSRPFIRLLPGNNAHQPT